MTLHDWIAAIFSFAFAISGGVLVFRLGLSLEARWRSARLNAELAELRRIAGLDGGEK